MIDNIVNICHTVATGLTTDHSVDNMNKWTAPQRPNSYAEHTLINAILDGTFPAGSSLPGERTLAEQLGITRPTLREAIQRLARDGWLSVQHGKATLVNNIWRDGGLNVLTGLVKHSENLPKGFIANLLELRLNLAPAYTRGTVSHAPAILLEYLNGYANLPDNAFSRFRSFLSILSKLFELCIPSHTASWPLQRNRSFN